VTWALKLVLRVGMDVFLDTVMGDCWLGSGDDRVAMVYELWFHFKS
jgi:hypothetical protein